MERFLDNVAIVITLATITFFLIAIPFFTIKAIIAEPSFGLFVAGVSLVGWALHRIFKE